LWHVHFLALKYPHSGHLCFHPSTSQLGLAQCAAFLAAENAASRQALLPLLQQCVAAMVHRKPLAQDSSPNTALQMARLLGNAIRRAAYITRFAVWQERPRISLPLACKAQGFTSCTL